MVPIKKIMPQTRPSRNGAEMRNEKRETRNKKRGLSNFLFLNLLTSVFLPESAKNNGAIPIHARNSMSIGGNAATNIAAENMVNKISLNILFFYYRKEIKHKKGQTCS